MIYTLDGLKKNYLLERRYSLDIIIWKERHSRWNVSWWIRILYDKDDSKELRKSLSEWFKSRWIPSFRDKLDYIIMNEDRHLNNFGIIRDVNSLERISVAPIFDNGESLKITYDNDDELCISGEGRFFYQVKPFNEIIKVVKDIKKIDLSKLYGVVEWYDNLLHMYQYITGISDNRINKLCILLNRQINNLKELQSKGY